MIFLKFACCLCLNSLVIIMLLSLSDLMVQFFKTFSKKNNFYSNKFSLYDFLPLKNPKTSLYVCVNPSTGHV